MNEEPLQIEINPLYQRLIEKILKHRPHLKDNKGAAEKALDFYLDFVVRTDIKK